MLQIQGPNVCFWYVPEDVSKIEDKQKRYEQLHKVIVLLFIILMIFFFRDSNSQKYLNLVCTIYIEIPNELHINIFIIFIFKFLRYFSKR